MEKILLEAKSPDGLWLATVKVDVDAKVKRIDWQKQEVSVPAPPVPPDDLDRVGELLI